MSPYFSPNSAMAPWLRAKSRAVSYARVGWSSATRRVARPLVAPLAAAFRVERRAVEVEPDSAPRAGRLGPLALAGQPHQARLGLEPLVSEEVGRSCLPGDLSENPFSGSFLPRRLPCPAALLVHEP